jgi:hypothetical protein
MRRGGAQAEQRAVTTAVTAEAAIEWARHARPGEKFVYFTGPALLQALPVVAAARALHEAGEVIFVQERRSPGVRDYVMLKRRNVEPPRPLSRAGVEERAPGTKVDDDLEDLMAVLRRLAARGLVCPSNARLADMAGLKDAESARYRLGILQQAGRIAVRTPPVGARIVTIVATGLSTAAGGQG